MPGLRTRPGERKHVGLLGRDTYASHRTETHSAMLSRPPVLLDPWQANIATLPADVQREIVGARRALRRDRSRVRPAQGRVCVGAITRMTRIDLRIMFYRRHDAAVVLWLIGLAGSRRK
jgi:hypothetical protein